MLRAGDGLQLTFDGGTGEISLIRPDWFIAEITGNNAVYGSGSGSGSSGSGSGSGSSGSGCPTAYKWKKKVPASNGCAYEDERPGISGDGVANPAYAIGGGGIIPTGSIVVMRLRGSGSSSKYAPIYEFIAGGSATSTYPSGSGSGSGSSGSGNWSGSGGNGSGSGSGQCFEVVQSISCDDGELSVTYATICPDSGTAIVVGQQNGNYVVSTRYSVTGGGKLSAFTPINLVGDVAVPGANRVYGTDENGARGWRDGGGAVVVDMSITGAGTTASPLKLVNDEANPGGFHVYGTGNNNAKGWQENKFTLLSDAPHDYLGNAGRFVAVNFMETGLEFSALTLGDFAAQQDLANLAGRVSWLENQNFATQQWVNDIDAELQNQITALQSAMVNAESNITTLLMTVNSLQSQVMDLSARLAAGGL